MWNFCKGSKTEIDDNLVKLQAANPYVVITMLGSVALASSFTTIFFFFKRKPEQRPTFVTLQMMSINIFWVCFVAYFALLTSEEIVMTEQSLVQNLLATIGDVFLLMHDWLYIKEILSASLMLPIVMANF